MDNPWASAWDPPQEADIASWSFKGPVEQGTVWPQADAQWDPATAVQHQDATSEQDITAQDQPPSSQPASLPVAGPSSATDASMSDHQVARSTSPPRDSFYPVPETSDATLRSIVPVARVSDEENLEAALNPSDDVWGVPWRTPPSSEPNHAESQPPDQWEAARQEKEKLNRAVPPESLDSLLRHCQQVLQDIWPASETGSEHDWGSGFDDLADITALLVQLVPADSTLPPTVQFSATATAKAMNEALKSTRHLPASASSPLSRLLASKGSLEWAKAIKTKQDIVPDTAHVGWRVLEKEDRLGAVEESRPRKATGGLLSFWNRKASAIQTTPVETFSERSSSPARSSLESVKSFAHPSSSQAALSISVPPPPPPDSQPTVVATAPAPSAVSRFLNRFSRSKSAQHSSLALSSDDLEFLSDIVPSASDSPDEDINDGALDVLTGASNSLPLPPKLPPPKRPMLSTRPSALGSGTLDFASVVASTPAAMQGANHTLDVPVLVPPLSPEQAPSFSRAQSPLLSLKDVAAPNIAFGQSNIPSIQQRPQPNSQPDSQLHSSFTLPLPQKVSPKLSVPPLLPPPPVSPPQTPRPAAFPPFMAPSHSSTMQSTETSFQDSYDSDDEFSAFTSFPPSASAPFQSSMSYPSHRSPSPPSPPPRHTYERTHYPSSSSISSILSPASQTSVDQLYSTGSAISAPLDDLDDFIPPSSAMQGNNKQCTPSPPPLPVKPRSRPWQPPDIDTFPSRVCHAHAPSQTFTSPTAHTSLLNNTLFPSVSDAEHQRTQSLVNHAAARGGLLWPNPPQSEEQILKPIPPPPSSSTSPKSLTGDDFDLLGDGGSETSSVPLSMVGDIGMDSVVSFPATGTLRATFGVAAGRSKGLGSGNQLQPSPPPLSSMSTPMPLSSSLGTLPSATATNPGLLQPRPAKPKQAGGLSAQDLSFFEGL